MATIQIASLADLDLLATKFGCLLPRFTVPILLTGEAGAGKTTFTQLTVNKLPGAENAIVSSPSFSICNFYPTAPPVLHCDLYRCESDLPEEILEAIDDKELQIIIEWAEFFPADELPEDYLAIDFKIYDDMRLLKFCPYGTRASLLLNELLKDNNQLRILQI